MIIRWNSRGRTGLAPMRSMALPNITMWRVSSPSSVSL